MSQHFSMEKSFNDVPEGSESEEQFDLRRYWQIILERRWLVVATSLGILILTVFYLFTSIEIFSSSTRLQIDRETENSMRMESFVMQGSQEKDYLQTQYQNLQSRTLMEAVLRETLINVSILDAIADGNKTTFQLASEVGITQTNLIQKLYEIGNAGFFGRAKYGGGDAPNLFKSETEPLAPGLFVFTQAMKSEEDPSPEELLQRLSSSVSVSPVRLSRLVDIVVESPNKFEAAMIANTVTLQFLENDNSRKRSKLANAIGFLKEEAASLSEAVHVSYMNLHKFKLDWDIISLEETQNTTLQALLQAQADYDRAHNSSVSLQAAANEAQRVFNETGQYSSIPTVVDDITIKTTRNSLALAQSDLAALLERYLEKHPKIIEKRSAINILTQSMEDSEKRIYDSILTKARFAQANDKKLGEVLTIRKSEQQSMNQKSIEYYNLERIALQAEAMYKLAMQRLKETELQEKDIVQNMHVIDLATPPTSPIKPRKAIILFIGLFGGLGAGVGLVFFVNFLDDSIKSQDDIENYLKLSFLGYIPNIKTNSIIERDMQAHLYPQSNSAEAFRTVRAAIVLSNQGNEIQILAVTSTVPSEGKSLVASNHAIVTAQTGAKTLLVDCDLRRPSVHKAFQIQSPKGLTSYLQGKVDSIESIAHDTEVPNLDIICCGAVPNNPSELAGSQRMLDFVNEIREKYEKVIFDCPPVSAVSDPLIIASMADGTVFVNKFNKIRREHARKTVQRVQDAGINIIGVAINDLDFEGKDSYYYSYYYYQNRYYASHYKSDKPSEENNPSEVKPAIHSRGQSDKRA